MDANRELTFYCSCHDFYVPILHRNPKLTKIISSLLKSAPVPQIPFGIFFACPECAALYVGRTDNLHVRPLPPPGQIQNPYGILCADRMRYIKLRLSSRDIYSNGTRHDHLRSQRNSFSVEFPFTLLRGMS
jgi:hypothetical protein